MTGRSRAKRCRIYWKVIILDDQQKATEYQPTQAEGKLIEVMLDPANRMKSITEVCRIAEINRATYYRVFDKPEFVELYTRKSRELAKKHLGPVMNSFVREATRGSFQHGKVLLEMAGAYEEKSTQKHQGDKDNPIFFKSDRTAAMSAEELKAAVLELIAPDKPELDKLPEVE